jgi:hypothetical protein
LSIPVFEDSILSAKGRITVTDETVPLTVRDVFTKLIDQPLAPPKENPFLVTPQQFLLIEDAPGGEAAA